MTGWDETPPPSWQEIAEGMATKLAAAKEEIEQLRADGQSWEYFAFLAFRLPRRARRLHGGR